MKLIKNSQVRSLVRTALKVVGTALVTMQVVTADEAIAITEAVQAIAGSGMVLYGIFESWKDKKAE